jgi:Protein of unknown function (DUF1553)/Protein of unknown function (DUF1549)
MGRARWVILGSVSFLVVSGFVVSRAAGQSDQLPVSDSMCSYFGPEHEKVSTAALKGKGIVIRHPRSDETVQVLRAMSYVPPGGPTYGFGESHKAGSIDSYIWADFQKNGINPAPATTDWEFVRRVTLDLTGRIPTPTATLAFVNNTSATKRADYIESLLASPQWVDKWTMYYGDQFQNVVNKPSTGVNRFAQGRNAFYQYIHDSLANGKPYNQMASELISTANDNSYTNGPINWLVGYYVPNGPAQDTFDAMTAAVSDTFLGITYVNCLLCHNGAGHLTQINLWGSQITRYQGWQLASFMSHTQPPPKTVVPATPATPVNNNIYWWSLQDNTKNYTVDYTLNTTSGNRPARVAPAGCKSGQPCYYVPPQYIFNGDTPPSGQTYRASMADEVTKDFQFARAAVNYIWAQFFGMGIVDPPDTFDLARLDPNNPPPAPWTLQPTNPNLLNALATHFVQSGYNVKALMREIVNSQTYQLSSRYNGTWQASYEPYFARKYVRRLWSEEVYDAVAQSSGYQPAYTMTGFTDQGFAQPTYAMQFPDTTTNVANTGPKNTGDLNNLLNYFLRGNRDDQVRKQDGSILQALALMNNPMIEMRTTVASYGGNPIAPLISQNMTATPTNLINMLYLTILSRYPSTDEMTTATAALSTGTKNQAIQNLAWSIYNKVDFVFNY